MIYSNVAVDIINKTPLRRGPFYRFIMSLLALALVDPTQYTTHPESIPLSCPSIKLTMSLFASGMAQNSNEPNAAPYMVKSSMVSADGAQW